MSAPTLRPTSRKRRSRGAVLVEFIIAFVPLMMIFFSFVQLAKMAATRLMLKHATVVATRAAAVMTNNNDTNPCSPKGMNEQQILMAAKMALGSYDDLVFLKVNVTDTANESDPYGWVTVRLTGTYDCNVPLGGLLVCGPSRRKTMYPDEYKMPHQGALYKCQEGTNSTGGGPNPFKPGGGGFGGGGASGGF